MRLFAPLAAAAVALAVALPADAEEKIDHYAAERPESLQEALATFKEYNGKVRAVLARDNLSLADMEEIHEYTYSIEAALAKIRESVDGLAVTLESLHLASEAHNADAVRGIGEVYFEMADDREN